MFSYQGWYLHKGNFVFNIKYGKFWLDGYFFVRNLGTSVFLPLKVGSNLKV